MPWRSRPARRIWTVEILGQAEAEHLPVSFVVADAEALPFDDNSFDNVMSTFGVMFTPDHERAAREMLRVTAKGGRIALANWTPDGFIGHLFKTLGKHVPPAPGARSPALWGTRAHLEAIFGEGARTIEVSERTFNFRYRSPEHFIDVFRTYYGPVHKAFLTLDVPGQLALESDLKNLLREFNVANDGTLKAPGAYIEAVIQKD